MGAVAAAALLRRRETRRLRTALALARIGTATTVLSGPTHIALSNDGRVSPVMVTTAILATVSRLVLAWFTLRTLGDAATGTGP